MAYGPSYRKEQSSLGAMFGLVSWQSVANQPKKYRYTEMKKVELHGVRHRDVYKLLEKLHIDGDVPFVVITGRSSTMKKIVVQIAHSFGLSAKETIGNPGRLIVNEGR